MVRRFLLGAGVAVGVGLVAGVLAVGRPALADEGRAALLASRDSSGELRTLDVNGPLDLDNPFFKDLGTNGRSCFSCHRPEQGWSITPESVRRRFDDTRGLDPIFRSNDGSNCEGADISTLSKRRTAFSLLMNRGLIRIAEDVPVGAEFVIDSVDDPYGCNVPLTGVSVYRRPLPSTNLTFLSAVMWDGRESLATSTNLQDLAQQADDATTGHAQASLHLTPAEQQAIVSFETGLYTAQARDERAGSLHADNAYGGPRYLSKQPFFIGINDPVGLNPSGAAFDPSAFTLFASWSASHGGHDAAARARASIARGEVLFNTKPIVIAGVAGLNNFTFASGVTVPDPFTGNCTTCHDTPSVGDHSVKAALNIGLTDASRRTPDQPLYTLRRLSTGETITTTDPGRAIVTGKWADIGKFKGPVLRGLAARAPYFHNGSAASLEDAIDFYETRFNLGLTLQEKADLAAFLRAL